LFLLFDFVVLGSFLIFLLGGLNNGGIFLGSLFNGLFFFLVSELFVPFLSNVLLGVLGGIGGSVLGVSELVSGVVSGVSGGVGLVINGISDLVSFVAGGISDIGSGIFGTLLELSPFLSHIFSAEHGFLVEGVEELGLGRWLNGATIEY